MQTITLRNFKSYEAQTLPYLSPHINVIVGGNGQGKSNFLKALAFLLSDKITLNRTQFNNYLHRGLHSAESSISIQVTMRGSKGGDSIKIAREWHPDLSQKFSINEKYAGSSEFQGLIESLGITYSNPYNIIQQGKITQITLMDGFELYKLLEEATGIKKFRKREQEAIATLKKAQGDKEETVTIMAQLDSKLKALESRRQQFQFYAIEEKTRKARTKLNYDEELQGLSSQLRELNRQYQQHLGRMKEITERQDKAKENLENINLNQKVIEEKISYYQQEANQGLQVAFQKSQSASELKKHTSSLSKIEGKIKVNSGKLDSKNKALEKYKTELESYQNKYQLILSDLQLQDDIKKKTASKQKYTEEIQQEKQKIKEIEQELKKLEKFQGPGQVDIEKEETSLRTMRNQLYELTRSEKQNKISQIEANRAKNNLQAEIEACKTKQGFILNKLHRSMPILNMELLDVLQKENIRGVHGYLLQFVRIEPDMEFAYEIAGLSKLCTLIVENEAVCNDVIAINRKIKGKQVNMIPLSFLRKNPAEKKIYPKSDDALSLINEDWMTVDPTLQPDFQTEVRKLINNSFNKYMLVKDYETALSVSKEYHLNCITSDREIVYSEGYLCKVGRDTQSSETRIHHFTKYIAIKNEQKHLSQQIKVKIDEITRFQQQQLDILRNHNNLQAQIRAIEENLNLLQLQKRTYHKLNQQEQKLKEAKNHCKSIIANKERALQCLQTQKNVKVDPKEFKKVEQEFQARRKAFDDQIREIYDVEETGVSLAMEEATYKKKIRELKAKEEEAGNYMKFESKNEILQQLEATLQKNQDEKVALEKEIQSLEDELVSVEESTQKCDSMMQLFEQQQQQINSKIKELGVTEDNMLELEEHSNSLSVSMIAGKTTKKHHYTAKDKLFFSKFSNIRDTYETRKSSFKDLLQVQKDINTIIDRYSAEADTYMQKMTTSFEKEFNHIFRKIVPGGETDVRCKQTSEKVKNTIRYRNCLSVKVTFDAQQSDVKKWNDCSGGQKTVVAIAMLMALQRCEPAPFYIFDEVDSAVDKFYSQRIMELIREQSQTSQYFITSFKEEILDFPEDICQYYCVESDSRVSRINRVDRPKAREILATIIN